MEINGLPLHPLVVHATVAVLPLTALAALGYVVSTRYRDRLRVPLQALVVVAAVLVWITTRSGVDLLETRLAGASGPLLDQIQTHQQRGTQLRNATWIFAAVTLGATFLRRAGLLRTLLLGLVAVGAVVVLVLVFLAGESGARAVWGS